MSHTPGPWKACPPRFGHQFVRQDPADWDGQGYQHICTLPQANKGTYYGEMFASNARLIVAAPDMLEAVQGILAVSDLEDGEVPHCAEFYVASLEAALAKCRSTIAKATMTESGDATGT